MTARRVVGEPGDWDALRRDFRWDIPDDFNMAEAC